ncbi:haloacid dehalogenase [Campylobacter pinnipediorum subsp. pinnipediorum]|uniref:HAD family hydrolase n=1 Tax=Campylobacter pinnipediorum TaxID=1965231 RepID=UPI000995CF7C|nr:HAD family hydrolase [Campylobacter pinnipediorum]OPA76505.1 haloacid dehalogenase [Campylobacter pinnipediorum subsp. pinnipediorum]
MKVVIFDMDGTVIDSSTAIEKTINGIRKDMGLDELAKAYITKVINEPGRNLAFDLYGIQTPSTSLKKGFEAEFEKNYDLYATTYNGVKELLQKCKDNDYKIVLASNAPEKTLSKILEKNEILHFFDEVIGASKDVPEKPDPTMLNLAIDKTGATKAVFVGDSLKDKMAADNAKIDYIQVNWGFGVAIESKYSADTTDQAWQLIEKI